MNEAYTFIILSTVGSDNSVFTRDQRYQQTLETIQSIKQYASGAKIVFVDNSIIPLNDTERSTIESDVDLYVDYENTLFSSFASNKKDNAFKGINELLMMEKVLPLLKAKGLINKRVFKVSGRYKLMPNFNLNEYNYRELENKYVFKSITWRYVNQAGEKHVTWHDARLWSFCGKLCDHYIDLLPSMFAYMYDNKSNLELAHTYCIPIGLVLFKEVLHIEGNVTNGEYLVA